MIQMPEEIAKLFMQDSISKNFRVNFPNGEFRDLINADLVSESVIFTDAVSSDGKLKFGMSEAPSIEFSTYFTEDINKLIIKCGVEIDITSLDEEIIEEYGQTSEDVPYTFYYVPYGYFIVNSCEFKNTGICEVVAYSGKLLDARLRTLYNTDVADFTKLKLALGALYYPSNSEYKPTSNPSAKLSLSELLSPYSFLDSPLLNSFDELSPVFSTSAYSPFNLLSSTEKEFVDKPILKTFVLQKEVGGLQREYLIYVRGKRIVFGDTLADFYSHNDLGIPIGNTNDTTTIESDTGPYMQSSKYMETLPYNLSSEHSYKIYWENTKNKPARSDFAFSELYDYLSLKNRLDYIMSPCVIYKEVSTRPSSVAYVSGQGVNTHQYESYNFLFPTHCLYQYNDSSVHHSEYYGDNPYYENSRASIYTDYLHLDITDPVVSQSTLQNFINISPISLDDGKYSLNVFPKPLEFENVDYGTEVTSYLETVTDMSNDPDSGSYILRPRHFELGIPTELVIVSASYISPDQIQNFRHLPTSANPDVNYYKEVIQINDFASPVLNEYANYSENHTIHDISIPLTNVYAEDSHTDIAYAFETPLPFDFSLPNIINPRPYFQRTYYSMAPFSLTFENIELLFSNYRILVDYAEINALLLKSDRGNLNTWKLVSLSPDVPFVYPSDDLYPDESLYPLGFTWRHIITSSLWRKLQNSRYKKYPYNKVICTVDQITYESIVVDVSDDDASEYEQYDISDNWFITHGMLDIQHTLDVIASALKRALYYTTHMTMRGLPYIESGDMLYVLNKNEALTTLSARQRIKGIQSLITDVENN